MTALRDALAKAMLDADIATVHPNGVTYVESADAILATDEMQAIREVLRDHRRYNDNYWHPGGPCCLPESIRAWVEEQ